MIPIQWLKLARADIGQTEVLGPNDSMWLRSILKGYEWLRGQPWCGTAVRWWMVQSGIKPPAQWWRARAWLDWGVPVSVPMQGAVAIFDGGARGPGAGHVGIIEGVDARGRVVVIGGNQRDRVGVDPFDMSRLLGMRWPADRQNEIPQGPVPVVQADGRSSTSEG